MNLHYFQRMFAYNDWMNRRVWAAVIDLSDEQFTQPNAYSIGSVHRQVVHTMAVELLWYSRAHGINPESLPKADAYPTRDLIRARWDEISRDWHAYLATLSDGDLTRWIEYQYITKTGTEPRRMRLWEVLTQTLNHSTDHRAQILAALHAVGGRTLEQDYTLYTWDHPDE
jgi:uncharacterized damage-inducible protein DinB